jgi:hypothetical protein
MGPELKLMRLAGTIALALSSSMPAIAASEPGAAGARAELADNEPAPGQQQPPPPSGCPFRDGKLELIV